MSSSKNPVSFLDKHNSTLCSKIVLRYGCKVKVTDFTFDLNIESLALLMDTFSS